MHKNLGAQMLTRGLEVKDLKNWRKVIFTMLTLAWSLWKDKLASGAKNFSWIVKYKNSTWNIRKAVELTLKQIPNTAGTSVMVSTGKRKGNLSYCHLARFQKKEVSSQAGKKTKQKNSPSKRAQGIKEGEKREAKKAQRSDCITDPAT